MATTAQSNKVQDIGFEQKVPFKVDTTGSNDINQGDMVYIDTSAHQVKSVATDGNCATLVGVAADTSFRNLYGTKQYPDSGTIQVYVAGIFTFNTTASDSFADEVKAYIGADAQTVTSVDPGSGNEVGTAKLRPGITSITGAAGTTVDIRIVPRWPFTSVL